MSRLLVSLPSLRATRRGVAHASTISQYRYKNPAYVPDPDPDNIETHTGPLDIQPPPSDLQKQPNTTGYEGTWKPLKLDVNKRDSPLGSYPRSHVEPHQFRHPLKYKFDAQNRREFGQYIQDEDEILNIWGPNVRQSLWRQNLWLIVGFIGLAGYGAFWRTYVEGFLETNPLKRFINPNGRTNPGAAPPQYPFDGLIRELGGDPNNPDDADIAAFHDGDERPQKPVGFDAKQRKGYLF